MKIAQIVCTYPPYHGGMGNVVYETASGLAKLGHEVEVLTPHYYSEEEAETPKELRPREEMPSVEKQIAVEKDLALVARRLKPILQKGNAAYIPQIQNELDDFDLVHLHHPFYGVANLVRKWKLRNPHKPLVITYHMDNRAPGWLGLFFKYYAKYWMPKILNSADIILASSLDYIEHSSAGSIYLQNKSKWRELSLGVDIEKFIPRPKPETLFSRYGLDLNQPLLLFVGGMDRAHYFKGIQVLLQALHKLKKDGFELPTLLVGEGELRPEYEAQAKFLGLNGFVKFAGQASREELPYFYNMADLFVLPSINQSEAFGMVLLEAFASGVPVVASNLPGVRQVALDGGEVFNSGNYLELAEALVSFFTSDFDKQSARENARLVAEQKYSWDSVIRELDSIYQQLAGKTGN